MSVVPCRLEVCVEIVNTPLEGRVDTCAARQSVWALQPGLLVTTGGSKLNALMPADALHMCHLGEVAKTMERCRLRIFQ